jgi:hypothetical protein
VSDSILSSEKAIEKVIARPSRNPNTTENCREASAFKCQRVNTMRSADTCQFGSSPDFTSRRWCRKSRSVYPVTLGIALYGKFFR